MGYAKLIGLKSEIPDYELVGILEKERSVVIDGIKIEQIAEVVPRGQFGEPN